MKRNEFLKSACTSGLCGCLGLSLLTGNKALANSKSTAGEEEWDGQIAFMQARFTDLIHILDNSLDKDTLIPILNQLGAKCGEGFANQYKGNPEGFFNFIKGLWAESVEVDNEKGIITVNEKVRNNCNCPMVKEKEAPDVLCNCSLGTQKRIYESLYGRPVKVSLNKSILRGDERCSFTIQLL